MKDEKEIRERLAALPRLLTLKAVAAELGLPVWTLRKALWNGELPQVRLGKSIRIDRNDLEAWLARLKVRGPVL
jgi:excisionase family DNA binding protein